MRGERATLGKSLLDVQRDLKIKATYIAAIENADVSAFETPGFIAGYVRSYAKYLQMDPEWAYDTFCQEADYTPRTGLDPKGQAAAPNPKAPSIAPPHVSDSSFDNTLFSAPRSDGFLTRSEPGAIGSSLVLLALIAAIGYGGWAVLREIQQVQVTPVEQIPGVVAEVDPLTGATDMIDVTSDIPGLSPSRPDALDRLYRPQALDVPVMVARDGPIATIDPGLTGALRDQATGNGPTDRLAAIPEPLTPARPLDPEAAVDTAFVGPALADRPAPKVLAEHAPAVLLVAVSDAWVRVRSADGTTIYERTMAAGDTFALPPTEQPATLRTGAAGSIYFMVNGETHGPAGASGEVIDNIALESGNLAETYAKVDPSAGGDAQRAVEVAEAALAPPQDGPSE